jgi:DNA-directed RNA polymerase, mitochondrial
MLTTDLLERQFGLEAEAVELGAERYRKERPMPWRNDTDKAAEQEEVALPPGRQLLKQIIVPVARHIEEAKESASAGRAGRSGKAMPMLNLMEAEAIAYITARAAINGATKRLSLARLATDVAEGLRDHLNYDSIKRNEPAFFRSLMKANQKAGNYGKTWRTKIRRAMKSVEELLVTWSIADRIQIGTKCLELLVGAVPDLFEIVREPNPKTGRQELVLRPTAKLTDWFERMHGRCELLNPIHLPMVVPPKPWTTPFSGGYLGGRAWLVKGASRPFLEDLAAVDMPLVYKALNDVQSTAWRINRPLLEVMRQVWQAGSELGKLPRREPGCPICLMSLPSRWWARRTCARPSCPRRMSAGSMSSAISSGRPR